MSFDLKSTFIFLLMVVLAFMLFAFGAFIILNSGVFNNLLITLFLVPIGIIFIITGLLIGYKGLWTLIYDNDNDE